MLDGAWCAASLLFALALSSSSPAKLLLVMSRRGSGVPGNHVSTLQKSHVCQSATQLEGERTDSLDPIDHDGDDLN